MGDPQGFLKVKRQNSLSRPVDERVKDFCEIITPPADEQFQGQASRCMDCGTPFCHWGCPVGNYIPEWNDLMFQGHWKNAIELLTATNSLPEITGRVCPAYCEHACVLGINDDAVTIRENELAIIEYAFKQGLIKPRPPRWRSGKKVAVIGSGPAGLSCAHELNKMGHRIVVWEKDDRIGGILRYGIPDFKLEKWVLDRRIRILKKEGIEFIAKVNVGVDYPLSKLEKEFDAACLTIGSRVPQDLKIEGRGLEGIYFAMDFLTQENRRVAREKNLSDNLINAREKSVVIIGGGNAAIDAARTALRLKAKKVTILYRRTRTEMPADPEEIDGALEEGVEIIYLAAPTKIWNSSNMLKLECSRMELGEPDASGRRRPIAIPDSEFEIKADLVILALGFVHPEKEGLLEKLGVQLTEKGTVQTDENYATSRVNIFAAGDARRGASLVVWAIYEGRLAAQAIDKYLKKKSLLSKFSRDNR